jgi:hypothetical protein
MLIGLPFWNLDVTFEVLKPLLDEPVVVDVSMIEPWREAYCTMV